MTPKKVVDNTPPATTQAANPFQSFVEERFVAMASAADADRQEAIKQGVTVRLEPGVIRGLDAMAKNLELSRQQLLVEIITKGLRSVIEAYADGHRPDEAQVVYRALMDEMSPRAEDL